MTVNSSVRVPKLNADKLDGRDATDFLGTGQKAADSDKLDSLDSTDLQRANAQAGGDLSGNYPNPQITNGAVTTFKLANNSVTSFKIQDGQVQRADLANGVVGTDQLGTNAVTSDKVTDNAISSSSQVANGSLDADDIAKDEKISGGPLRASPPVTVAITPSYRRTPHSATCRCSSPRLRRGPKD